MTHPASPCSRLPHHWIGSVSVLCRSCVFWTPRRLSFSLNTFVIDLYLKTTPRQISLPDVHMSRRLGGQDFFNFQSCCPPSPQDFGRLPSQFSYSLTFALNGRFPLSYVLKLHLSSLYVCFLIVLGNHFGPLLLPGAAPEALGS